MRMKRREAPSVNETRFNEVFAAYHDEIWRYAMRRCTYDDAINIVSDTFLTAWRRVQDIPAGDNARLWLYKVAGHCAANQQRGQRRYLRLVSRLADNSPPVNTTEAEGVAPDHRELRLALAQLSRSDQELLRLLTWEELSHEQVATVLGISANAVALRARRARRNLRSKLDDQRHPQGRTGHVGLALEVRDDER